MRTFVALALVCLAVSSRIINKSFVSELKKKASFEVYDVEENPFRDWTDEEIRAMLALVDVKENESIVEKTNDAYDFREDHPECMLGIRNQLSCGSCWAFSGVMSMQERFCLKSQGEVKVILSPQDSVSCDKGNMGCNGGWLAKTWSYYKTTGLVDDDCFPYSSGEGDVEDCITECKNGAPWKKYKISEYSSYGKADKIKKEITANGPVETGFNVYADFMSYKGGIYVHESGSLQGGHAVVILGWGTEDGIDYWICQNSWGEDWGEQGYFRIKMGICAIDAATYGGVPIL